MSSSCDTHRYDHPNAHEVLPLDLLKDAAELHAAGHGWEEIGPALGRNPTHLRLACRRDPRFAAELEDARREVLREIEAEVLRKMREHMLSEDSELAAARAAERLANYLTTRRNCETRLQVEAVKKDAKLGAERIKASAKAATGGAEQEGERPVLPPELEGRREHDGTSGAYRAAEQPARGESALDESPGLAPATCRREQAAAGPEWVKPGAPAG